jgi:L-threonylcarbamoyladenylate synthase
VAAQNTPFETQLRPYGRAAIAEAARLLLEGLPVATPTETVYGLAADATNAQAVARIYEAKGRPGYNPLIVHVGSLADAERIAHLSDAARTLAAVYWPGALTMVLRQRDGNGIAPAVTAGLDTIAVRVPAHPVMRDLLAACAGP